MAVTPHPPPTETLEQTGRSRLRLKRDRGSFDRTAAETVLDEAPVAHVAAVTEQGPIVLPMAHARIGARLYVLELARSAFHHSMDDRSVVLFGTMERVLDRDEKRAASVALVEYLAPGRFGEPVADPSGEARPLPDHMAALNR